jgi:hypothetical protein
MIIRQTLYYDFDMKQLLTTIIMVIVLCACQDKNIRKDSYIIPAPKEFKSIDNLDITYEIKKLQDNTDIALLGDVSNIEISANYIYCLERNRSVHIFDSNGNFVKRIAVGRGPGELIMPMDICLNPQNGNLNVLTRTKIMEFSPDGNYLGTNDMPSIMYMEVENCGNLYLLYSARYSEKNTNYFRIYNSINNQITPIVDAVNLPPILGRNHMAKSSDGGIYFNGMYGNIIYKLNHKDGSYDVKYTLDNVAAEDDLNITDPEEWSDNNEKYLLLGDFREYKNGLWGMTVSKKTRHRIIYNPAKQEAYELEHITGLVYVGFDMNNDYYTISPISVLNTDLSNIKSKNLKKMFNELYELSKNNEEGNPFLIKMNYEL